MLCSVYVKETTMWREKIPGVSRQMHENLRFHFGHQGRYEPAMSFCTGGRR